MGQQGGHSVPRAAGAMPSVPSSEQPPGWGGSSTQLALSGPSPALLTPAPPALPPRPSPTLAKDMHTPPWQPNLNQCSQCSCLGTLGGGCRLPQVLCPPHGTARAWGSPWARRAQRQSNVL